MVSQKVIIGVGILLGVLILIGFVTSQATPTPATGAFSATTATTNPFTIKVNIPCQGHAPLILNALRQTTGVTNVTFTAPNLFNVSFEESKTNTQTILAIPVFSQYPAQVVG